MKKGYSIFGKAYEVMLRNDLHDIDSIDHQFMREMVYLDEESYPFLYANKPMLVDMSNHELYDFAKQFKGKNDLETIKNILAYTSKIVENFDEDFSKMKFGGTEKEIIERGTDWCADIARVGVVLLTCNNIPSRIIHLVNLDKAYNAHVAVEAYYEGCYGVCDFTYGYYFYDTMPLDAYTLMCNKEYLIKYPIEYSAMYSSMAINEYNPMDRQNKYIITTPNQYYLTLINNNHNNEWIMNEDK